MSLLSRVDPPSAPVLTLRGALHRSLHAQIDRLPLPPSERQLTGLLIDALDADGYLRGDLADVTARAGLDGDRDFFELRTALRLVQSLEPAGVGARTPAERHMLQLLRSGPFRVARLAAAARRTPP